MFAFVTNLFEKWFNDDTFIDEPQTEILQILFFYMRAIHTWPKKGQTLKKLDICIFALFAFPVAPPLCTAEIVDIMLSKRNYVLDDILSGAALVGTAINVYCLLAIFMKRNKNIFKLVQDLGDFRQFPKPKNFDKMNKRLDKMTHIAMIYVAGGVFLFFLFGLFARSECLEENRVLKLDRICGMIAPPLLPASFNENPNYWFACINQTYTSMLACIAAILILVMILGTTEILITRIQDFKHVLKQAFQPLQNNREVSRKEYLKYCVRYHCYILELGDQLNDNLASFAFILASFTSGIIALTSFQFMLKPEAKTLIHCLAWVMVLMFISGSGQRLIDESSLITEVIYSTDWFVGNVDEQKFIQIMILRSNHYMFVSSIFGQVSFETFTAVIKNAYSFLTLLANMQQDE